MKDFVRLQSEEVDALIKKAVEAEKPDDAMKFSQAALNAANAIRCLEHIG
jgi:hypothetical protein